jgi:hypothetical protein
MEQGSTTNEAADTERFAGDAWFDPIEAGIRERVRGFVEPEGSPDIQDLPGRRGSARVSRSDKANATPGGSTPTHRQAHADAAFLTAHGLDASGFRA